MSFNVTEETFGREVIERSRELPVVVDFWAEWCGPCRALTPALEKAEAPRKGKVVLAKLDTDANQSIARQYGIQSIPAVKAFRDGEVVSEFIGVLPPAQVEEFFDQLAPSKADELVEAGDEASLRDVLEMDPKRADAGVALARLLLERGEEDATLELLEKFPNDFAAEGLAARIRLQRATEPDLSDAFAALDEGAHEQGLDRLIEAVSSADGATDDIRRVVVGVLDELGADNPLSKEYRRRLAAALY